MKNPVLVIVISALVIILGLQTYMIFDLNSQLKQLQVMAKPDTSVQAGKPGLPSPAHPPVNKNNNVFDDNEWNPYAEMQHMQNQMEQLFGDSFSRFHMHTPLGSFSKSPDADLQEQSDRFIVTVNAPGADENSIHVSLDDRRLTISIKTQESLDNPTNDTDNYRYRERFVGEFHRVMTLPAAVKAAEMKTEYKNGVLTITIPKQ